MVAKGGNKMEYSTDKCFTIQQVEKFWGFQGQKSDITSIRTLSLLKRMNRAAIILILLAI